ncbi:MAG: PD-(D/E)XK nuclease family protein, partial [Phycisphaerales bacterium]|nr:PD-(D/E)XK nuclease family protein [Phycisphaerales bacterium]
MSVRLIAGRAGSGKTRFCLNEIRQELARSRAEGPRLIFLVPEQAALQSERLLLALSEGTTLGRCEVLSFRRLAQRILSESTGGMPTPLTPIGRQMAVRFLLGRDRQQFMEFGRLADRGGFVAELAGALSELFRESVSVERLEACAKAAESEDAPTFPRLHDLAILYRAYCDYLGDDRVDPDGVLALARARMAQADWLRGARVWADGFASFTREQLTTLVELSRLATSLDVAILLDPARVRDDDSIAETTAKPDEADLFAKTLVTMAELFRSFAEAGVPLEPVKRLTDAPTRFSAAPALSKLEQRLFTQPGATGDEPDAPPPVKEFCEAQLVVAGDLRDEARAAARAILDLTRRDTNPMRYRDIAVLVRSLEPYHDLLSAELRRHGIPFFIDRRRPTHHHPLVRLVRGLVSLIGGLSFESSMAQILKSSLTGISTEDADAIDNYVLANGLTTPVQWESTWTRKPPGFDDKRTNAAKQAVAHVEAARIALRTRFDDFWPGAAAPTTCRNWITRLSATLERFNVRQTLDAWSADAEARGDLDEASEHVQVWSGIVDLLEELVAALGDVELRGRQFRETLESGLSELTLGLVPPTLDQVIVSSVDRGRQPPGLRAAFVLGLADGLWPGRIVDEGLLGDEERAFLENKGAALGRSRLERLREERLLLYVGVTRASQVLWISRPRRSDDGKEMQPSLYWANLRAALGDEAICRTAGDAVNGISTTGDLAVSVAAALGKAVRPQLGEKGTSLDSSTLSVYNWAAHHHDTHITTALQHALTGLLPSKPAALSDSAVKAVWAPPHETSVTQLESFARCEFQHFARYGLRLRPRDVHELSDV